MSHDYIRRAIAREAELLEPYVSAGLAIPPTTPAEETPERRRIIAAVADLRAREDQLRTLEQDAAKGYTRGRDDERTRCSQHALAEINRDPPHYKASAGPCVKAHLMRLLDNIRRGKAAA